MTEAVELLLLSNSAMSGRGLLEHALEAIADLLGTVRRVHFVPYALADHDGYTARVQSALAPLGAMLIGVHRAPEPRQAIEEAEAVFVGGGNTFRLLRSLQQLGLLEPVRRRVLEGSLRYMGASAGTNVACPTLRTTNDMPIVQPASFEACGLVPFQINPHYLDPVPGSAHMGETRERRLEEFLEENDVPVLGMREGAWLRRRGARLRLDGLAGARLFRRGQPPRELGPGTDLAWLLDAPTRFDSPG
jgi:dipeptidase E